VLEGIEAIMFRTIGDGPSLWEASLPPELLRLPDDLVLVDALLDDPAFFAPFAPYFTRCWAVRARRRSATCG
jgi:transposase, IS5 family